MGRRRKRNYFRQETEDAIIRYNECDDPELKEEIYREEIHDVLHKLVENTIHTYKFHYYDSCYEDLKHEVVVYLHERLNKYQKGKGKAFSYFSRVARNFLIVRNNENYSHLKNKDSLVIVDQTRDIMTEKVMNERQELLSDFMRLWSEWGIDNVERLFDHERDQRIGEAIFVLFGNAEDIDNYNKKALYILIREQADVKTQYITRVVNQLRSMFFEMSKDYLRNGIIDWDEYLLENEVVQYDE